MKRLLVAAVGLVSLGLASASVPATAADIAPRRMAPVAAPAYLPFNWGGWYAGLNLGGGVGGDVDGIMFGGQIGYNWQVNQIVFGIETDLQYSGQDDSFTLAGRRCHPGSRLVRHLPRPHRHRDLGSLAALLHRRSGLRRPQRHGRRRQRRRYRARLGDRRRRRLRDHAAMERPPRVPAHLARGLHATFPAIGSVNVGPARQRHHPRRGQLPLHAVLIAATSNITKGRPRAGPFVFCG